ncbi:MAG: glycine cleavage T C-terminal barrel domain-containing protein, partial [Pseudomonadota bacterium]
WGHEVGPTVTPLESKFAGRIDWSKDFTGKKALLAQREQGVQRQLMLFSVQGSPLLLHDEPVWCNDRIVGLTTSGTRGVRTGLSLCLAMVESCKGPFNIEVAGKFYSATRLQQVPHDPHNHYRNQ